MSVILGETLTRTISLEAEPAQMVTFPDAALMLRIGCSVLCLSVGVQLCPLPNVAPPIYDTRNDRNGVYAAGHSMRVH